MAVLLLTNSSIRESCKPPDREEKTRSGKPVFQKVYMDSKLRGFGVVVTRTGNHSKATYTFIAQREVDGRTVRVKIGRLEELSAEEARKRAHLIISDMLKGANPNLQKRQRRDHGISLAEAGEMYKEKPVRRSRRPKAPNTQRSHTIFSRHLRDWERRALAEITRSDVLARHKKLTAEVGPIAANNTLRWFRAVYNAAMLVHETLPPNPCIILTDYWNREERRRSPIAWENLRNWAFWADTQLRQRNSVRADLQLFFLFSGLRSEDARTIQSVEVNLPQRLIFRPKPKGGEDRAYNLPLSTVLGSVVHKRLLENLSDYPNSPWLFPTFSRDSGELTHVINTTEHGWPSPHRLRDTFITAAHEAGVPDLDQKVLVNHRIPNSGDVTQGYKRPSWDYLCIQQEKVTDFLLEKIGTGLAPREHPTLLRW